MVMRPAFDRCYTLDDGPSERPAFLSPAALAAAFVITALLFALLLTTPFWHATPLRPASRAANAKAVTPAASNGAPAHGLPVAANTAR